MAYATPSPGNYNAKLRQYNGLRNTLTRKLQRQTTIVQWPTQHPHPETTTPNYDSTMAYATPSPGNYNAKLRQYNGLRNTLTRKLQRQTTTIVQWPTQHPHPETTTPNYDSTMAYATPSPGNYNAKLRQYNGLRNTLTRKLQRQTTIVQWPTQHPHPETTTPNYDSTMAYATPSPGNYNAKLR